MLSMMLLLKHMKSLKINRENSRGSSQELSQAVSGGNYE